MSGVDHVWDGIRLTLEAAPMPMLLVDADGHIQLLNDAACVLLGADRSVLIGRSVDTFVPDAVRRNHAKWRSGYLDAPSRRAMGTGRDLELVRYSGDPVPVEIGLNPMRVEDEAYVLCSIVDLTERIRSEVERIRFEQEASEADRLRSLELLAGGVAHDFNNLLVSILGNASLVQSELDPNDDMAEWVEDIERAAARAAELAKQMLAFSGGGRFVVEPTDVSTLVREFVPLLRSLVPRTVALRTWLDERVPPVDADQGQLRQVITNLVGNAAAVMPSSGGSIGVRVTRTELFRDTHDTGLWLGTVFEGPALVIEVADDGPGIAAPNLRRIFDPFFTTRKGGHGMGLPAVMGIVRAHLGCLYVESSLGRGTTFRVHLPLPKAGSDSAEVPRLQGPVVLVIDDEAAVLRLADRSLRRAGFEVRCIEDPRTAIEAFRTLHEDIDLVLLDLSMPGLGGRDVYRELREIDPNVRVVVMSGYSEEAIQRRFLGKPVRALSKPFTAPGLVEAVQKALSEA